MDSFLALRNPEGALENLKKMREYLQLLRVLGILERQESAVPRPAALTTPQTQSEALANDTLDADEKSAENPVPDAEEEVPLVEAHVNDQAESSPTDEQEEQARWESRLRVTLGPLLPVMTALVCVRYTNQGELAQFLWPDECNNPKGFSRARVRISSQKVFGLAIMGRVSESGVDNVNLPKPERTFYRQLKKALGPDWYPKLEKMLIRRRGKELSSEGIPGISLVPISGGDGAKPTDQKESTVFKPARWEEAHKRAWAFAEAVLLGDNPTGKQLTESLGIPMGSLSGVRTLAWREIHKTHNKGCDALPQNQQELYHRFMEAYRGDLEAIRSVLLDPRKARKEAGASRVQSTPTVPSESRNLPTLSESDRKEVRGRLQ
jgi:hypothetical protein